MKEKYVFYMLLLVCFCGTSPTVAGQNNNDSCSINIYMYDSYGDGWNGNQLLLYQDNSLIDAFACSGSYSETTVYIPDGYVDLAWSLGSWAYECSFIITNNEGDTLYVSPNGMSDYSGVFETIEVSCSGCFRPANLHLSDRTAYQLTVSWNAVDSSTWLVEYGPYGIDHGNGTLVSTTDNYITLSGLSPYSAYQVYVARICDGDTSQWRSAVYATLCDEEACTYTVRLVDENSGNFSDGRILICTLDGGVVDTAQVPSDWYDYSYDYSLQGCPGTLLLKYEATNSSIEDYILRNRHIIVLDAEGDTVSYFNGYDAYYASGFYDTIDYSCPSCFAVVEPWIQATDSSSATVSWYGDAESYIVLYGPANSTSGYSSMTVYSTSVTLTGLQPMTDYRVQVRAYCGDGDTSRERTLYITTLPGIYERVYVSPNATGTPDGHAWATALGNFTTALNIASINREVYGTYPEVWVAVGTYHADTNKLYYISTEDSYAFAIFNGINVYGGFLGNETSLSQRPQFSTSNSQFSILDGEDQYGVLINSGYNESPTRWDGFVIQHGASTYGAGCLLGGNTILSNCWIRSNNASSSGGGIYLSGNNSRVENCVIDSNTASWGGGIYSSSYESDEDSISLVTNCIIQNNTATEVAGGVYVKCEIANCTIQNNSGRFGGGMTVYNGEIAHVHHNVIRYNTAETSGGGAYAWGGLFDNNLIYGNTTTYGGAIYSDGRMTDYNYDGGTFYNNTLVSNTATYGGGVYNSSDGGTYVNTIIWGNQTGDGPNQYYNSFRNIHHCALEGALPGPEEQLNISLAHSNTGTADSNYVAFVSPSTGDYHLADNSACIDGGDNVAPSDSIDIGGAARRQGWSIDLGAYESSSTSSCPTMESIVAENITYNSATITWTPVSSISGYMLRYGIQGGNHYDTLYVNDTTTTLSGLAVYSAYIVLVNPICSGNTSPHFSLVTFSTLPSPSEIVYVKPQVSGLGDGSSWDNAMNDPNRAIAIADAHRQYYGSPASVWLAAGTYYGNIQSDNAFTLVDGVNVYGGFAGNEPPSYDLSLRDFTINTSILHGGNLHRVLYQDYDFDSVTILSGLTITGGYISSGNGAGALLRGNTRLVDCIVTDNHVSTNWNYIYGAGIHASSSIVERPVTIERCTISNNGALTGSYLYGGALYMVNTILNKSVIKDNNSYYRTIYSYSGYNEINNCIINNNTAHYCGGVYNYYASLTINNSDIVSNQSESYSPIYTYYGNQVTLNNSVVWGNRVNGNRSSIDSYYNYIIHNCAFDGITESYASVITLSDSNDGTSEGINYPRFTDPTDGDYTLMTGSALIDAGDSNYVTATTDLDGNPRVQFEQVDIGCYENGVIENCPRVTHLTVGPVGFNSAYITFRHSGTESPSACQIELSTPSTEWTLYGTTAQEHLFLTGLDTNQQYYVRVRAVCDDTAFGSYSRTVGFRTHNLGNCDPLTIGTAETTDGGWCLPTNTCYYQSYTQQIYTSTEMGSEAHNIDTIGFQYVYPYDDTRHIDIYLAHTTQSHLSAFLPSTGFELVYSGPVNFTNTGMDYWVNIPLMSSFHYNGTSNLLVAMVDHTGSYTYCDNGLFRTHQTDDTRAAYAFNNTSTAYNPANPPAASLNSHRTNIRFMGACQTTDPDCPRPNMVVRNVTANSAEVEWVANNTYELQLRNVTAGGAYESLSLANGGTVAGLAQGTNYSIRIRNVCNGTPGDWYQVQFTTTVSGSPIVYVMQHAAGTADGSSWINATDNINYAQTVAAVRAVTHGTAAEVWVAAGTYYGDTTSNNAFVALEGVNVYGGFAGVEPEDYDIAQRDFAANPTILDGAGARRVLFQPSAFNIRTTWDGFVIQHGYLPSTGNSTYGHGAYLCGGFTLSNCTVRDNATVYDGAYHYGGGIYTANAGSTSGIVIDRCDIAGNGDSLTGGTNLAYGSALYAGTYTTIANSRLHHNLSRQGALYVASATYVHNTLIDHNRSLYSGAGVYANGTTYLENTTVANNRVVNTSAYAGGGIYTTGYLHLLNTAVWGNRGTSTAGVDNIGGSYNTTLFSHSAVEGLTADSIITLASDNFAGPGWASAPAFVNIERGDYRLHGSSALINRGTMQGYTTAPYAPASVTQYDLSGQDRVSDDTVDIGCYEFHNETYCLNPQDVTITNITENSAFLSYASRDGNAPYAYEIDLSINGAEWTHYTTTAQTSLFLAGLNPSTSYRVRVRQLCDTSGGSSDYETCTFNTLASLMECEPVIVGVGTSTTSGGVLPTYTYYNYSYTQQLYTAQELGNMAHDIDTVSFQYFYSTPYNRTINLYLAHTDASSLSGYIPSSGFQLVYSGTVNFNNTGDNYWCPIVLQTPFTYNGTDNLLVVMVDNSGWYQSSSAKFYTHATPNTMAVYSYRDGSPYDINNPPSHNSSSYRNNIRLTGTCSGGSSDCDRANVGVYDVAAHSAKVHMLVGSNYELQLRKDAVGEVYGMVLLGADSTLEGLSQSTTYYLRVRNICAVGDSSGWRTISFTTLPDASPIVYVASQPAGLADGSSWNNAMSDINRAMDYATARSSVFGSPAQVWVASGTYYGDTSSSSSNAFTLQAGINVYGGFAGNEPEGYDLALRDFDANASILDGRNQRRVLYQPSNFDAATAATWDGFTIQRGQINSSGPGAYIRAYSTLRNCLIKDNYSASYNGGGVYATGTSYSYYDSLNNYHTVYTPLIEKCQITNNRASSGGGAYVNYATMDNCLVANNTATNYGGGLYPYNYSVINNSTIVANEAYQYGGVYTSYSGCHLSNCILWGNNTAATVLQANNSSIQYSAVQDAVTDTTCVMLSSSNTGSFNSPRFEAPAAGAGYQYVGSSWQLADGSICIGRGSNDYVSTPADLAGNDRIQQGTVDMGCYETPYNPVPMPVYPDNIVYVTEGGAGAMDGTSWLNAMPDLQDAMGVASMYHYPVWVAEGTYYGDPDRPNAFMAVEGVNVYGGFAGNEPANYDLSQRDMAAHATILDGQNLQRVLYQPFSFNTLTVWDGLTLQNGRLNSGDGAGAYIYGNFQIVNCIVQYNTTLNGNGAGIFKTSNHSNPLYITNTLILDNTATNTYSYGGGLYAYYTTVTNCRISGNSAGYGAGVHSSTQCYFYNSIIDHNTVTVYPGYGAVYVNDNAVFENCDIVNNTCTYNTTSGTGGIYSSYNNGTFNNCIIWGNKRGYYVNNLMGTPTLHSSAIEGGYSGGTDIIDLAASNDGTDPTAFYVRFIDPENGDYHLHNSSPLIDAGNSSLVTQSTDLEGNSRIFGGSVDFGAYESSEESSCPSVIGLQAVNVTSSSARLAWSPSTGVRYLVLYGPRGSIATDSISTTDTTIALNNLVLNRTYTAKVRTICDSGAMSLFSIPVNFTTLCDTSQLLPLSDFTSLSPADSTIVYNSTVSFVWSALSNATSYDVYIWKSGTAEPATPTASGLPNPVLDNYTLPGYNYGEVYNWKVVAWNECINKVSPVMTLRANDRPNLHVSQITNSSPIANQTMTVQWTVVNDGNGNTPPNATWNDYIWVTGHSGVGGGFLYNVDEVLLATVPNLQSLNSGDSYTNSVQVSLPQDYIGNFFLFVLSDQYSANNIDFSPTGSNMAPIPYQPSNSGSPYPYLSSQTSSYPGNFIHSRIVESNESDNFFYKVINILPPPTPDLVVSHISHPTNTFSGSGMTIQWTVTNQGDAAAIGNWSDRVYIQPGRAVELDLSEAVTLGTFAHGLDTLAPSATYIQSASITIPISYMGDYTIFVATDVDNSLYESIYEQNNVTASAQTLNVTLTPPSDLVVSSVSYPQEMDANGSYTITYTVSNSGSSATHTPGWKDAIYISQLPQLTSTATRLALLQHNAVLDADSSYTTAATVTIPGNIAGGWYLFVVTDVDNQVFEYTYEDNNTYRSDTTVTILVPDLEVQTVTLSSDQVSPGQTFTLTYQVANVGSGTLGGTTWRDAVYMTATPQFHSNNATLLTSSRCTLTLPPDSTYSNTYHITLPTTISGNRYLWVVTDYQSNVFENGSEENNILRCADTLHTILPDLAVTSVILPDTVTLGSTMRVRWTVKNIGPGDVIGRSFQDRVNWGTETLYNASLSNITLNAGDSIVRNAVVSVPCNATTPGAVSVTTDVTNQITEAGATTNNTKAAYLGIVTAADLVVSVVSPTDSLWSGTTMPLRWMVTNQGNADVTNQTVTDRIYLSQSAASYNLSDSVGRYSTYRNLAMGETDTIDGYFTVPNGLSGNYYLHLVTNATGTVCESESANNASHTTVLPVYLSPWPDLTVSNVIAPDEVNIGEAITIQYKLSNIGTATLTDQPVSSKIYYSTSSTTYSTTRLLYTHTTQVSLPVADTVQLSATFAVPSTVTAGNYYILVVADANNDIYEHTGENNNTAHSAPMRVKVYPLDLAAYDLQGNRTVQWGEQVHQRLVVKNNSTVPTLSAVWKDAVYLSSDPILHNSDIQLHTSEHRTQLLPDSTYQIDFTFTVPMGTPASPYLIAVTDENANNPDINMANNVFTKQITVSSVPTADLVVSDFVILSDTVISGQTAKASYKVSNVGTVPLVPSTWTDKVFLSYNSTLESSDVEIGSLLQNRDTIAPNQYYYDTIDFTVPLPVEGNVNLIIKANASNTVFESVTDNNVAVAATTVALPLPGDLVVADIDAADSVVSGSRLHVTWNVRNIGENTLTGNGLRSLVYLSSDTIFDATDKLLGMTESNNIILPQNGALQQSLSARVAGLPEGDYHLIVKTNVRNAFNELNHDNNTTYSAFAVRLVIRVLEFNTPTTDTLINDQVSDFRLNVGTHRNETVRIHISSADSLNGAVNMIYVSHNTVGDNLHYDYSTIGQYTGNPELYIPATLPQYYGINLYGSTPTGTTQAVVVSADIIPFELRSVSPSMGGNTGPVTLELTGSRFRPDMQVWMAGVSDTLYPDTVIYVNYYKSFATFNLSGKDTGLYDVAVLNHCEGEAILANAFQIVPGVPDNLGYNLIFPASPRPNRNIVMTLEFGNVGNVDITGAVLRVTSLGGAWISRTPEGLNDHQTSILVPLTIEGEPDGLLRPGAQSTIPIYGYTGGTLIMTVERHQ